MNKPELNFDIVEMCVDVEDMLEVYYAIINKSGEIIAKFSEDEVGEAYRTWRAWMTDEESAEWTEYEMECKENIFDEPVVW